MKKQMKNFLYAGSITLLFAVIIAFANTNISSSNKNINNSASLFSSGWNYLLTLFNFQSDCSVSDIRLDCSADAKAGCFCAGGMLGLTDKIWQYPAPNENLNFEDAVNYCGNLGNGWTLPSLEDLSSVYGGVFYDEMSVSVPDYLKDSFYWTNNKDSVLFIKSLFAYKIENGYASTICVKDKTVSALPSSEIADCNQLQDMINSPKGDYSLTSDIDCSDTKNWNNGQGFIPIGNGSKMFSGSFDGNGHTISNLTINTPETDSVGLFGYSTGNISNVGLINVNIKGNMYVGGIAGINEGTISNSYTTGNISGSDRFIGGLVGMYQGGTTSGSYSTANITGTSLGSAGVGGIAGYMTGGTISTSYSTGNITAPYSTGGLVGGFGPGAISDSYSTGNISGNSYVGGSVGYQRGGTINNIYSIGKVTASKNIGGLVGYKESGDVNNSFWNKQTSSKTSSAGGVGKTTTEMKTQSTYTGWDFASVWRIETDDYPKLGAKPAEVVVKPSSLSSTIITSFNFQESVPAMANINNDDNTIKFEVPYEYNIPSSLTPMILFNKDQLDMGEYITPVSGIPQNFNSPVTYTITSTDGSTRSYVVSITKQAKVIGTESSILNLSVEQAMYNSDIDQVNKKIKIGITSNNDLSSISTRITVSNGATVSVSSGYLETESSNVYLVSAQNLTTPETYTVTSEDGLSHTTYTVSVAYPPTVTISTIPSTIFEKKTANITWTPIGATKCTASGDDPAWPGNVSAVNGSHTWTTGLLTVDNMTTPKIYTYGVICSNDAGTTDTMTKTVRVVPDYYPTAPSQTPVAGGSARMSDALSVAGVTLGDNEMMTLLYRDSYYYYKTKTSVAHIATCPTGTSYRVCVEDYNDGAYNHVLIGVK